MFTDEPELAPELDWMLQSGDAEQPELAAALVAEFYAPLYRLALSIFDNAKKARQETVEAFSTALLSLFRYRMEKGPRSWLFSIALEEFKTQAPLVNPAEVGPLPFSQDIVESLWRAFDRLEWSIRIPALLRWVHGWSIHEIATLLDTDSRDVDLQISRARRLVLDAGLLITLLETHPLSDIVTEDPRDQNLQENLKKRLVTSLQARWPASHPSPSELEGVTADVLERTRKGGKRTRRITSLKEVMITGLVILLVGGAIWGYNFFFPEPEPAISLAPSSTPRPVRTIPPTRTPTRVFYPPDPQNALYTVQEGDTVELVAKRLDVPVGELLKVNRLPIGYEFSLQPGIQLLIPGRITPRAPITVTPVTPVATLPPVRAEMPVDKIIERVNRGPNTSSTFWMDLLYVYYGPPAYYGPEQAYRFQFWWSDEQALITGGPAAGQPSRVMMYGPDYFVFAAPGEEQPWYHNMLDLDNDQLRYSELYWLFPILNNAFYLNEADSVENVNLAGREALRLDNQDEDGNLVGRSWIDPQNAMILRQQQFPGNGPNGEILDMRLLHYTRDISFPQELFDPWLPWVGGYATDYTGRPEPPGQAYNIWSPPHDRPRLPTPGPAPAGFDPAQSSLTFFYNTSPDVFKSFDQSQEVQLYAGEVFLGSFPMANPLFLYCSRSDDGAWLAYTGGLSSIEVTASPVQWIDLVNAELHTSEPPIYAGNYVFSPDSSTLAVYGLQNPEGKPGIFLVNSETGKYEPAVESGQVITLHSLAFSPDGSQLAYIGSQTYEGPSHLYIVNLETKELVLDEVASWDQGQLQLAADHPAAGWGLEELPQVRDLKTCAALPATPTP